MIYRRLFFALALSLTPALAHEIERDGNVAALLHTDPDDAPRVAAPTTVFFELNQRGGRPILLSQCTCTLSVYAGSERPGSKPLSRGVLKQGKGEVLSSVTFPVVGAYTLVLQGKPKTGSAFSPFKLSWAIRADTTASGKPMNH